MDQELECRDEAVRRVAQFLVTHRKHDDFECHMSVLSRLLPRRTAGGPRLRLKKLCLSRPDLFLVREEGQACVVRLRDPEAVVAAHKKATHMSPRAPTAADEDGSTPPSRGDVGNYGEYGEYGDYDALELHIIAHLFNQPGRKTSLPTLGEYCKTKLGVDMKHRLARFVDKRPGAFARDRDVRQQVWCVLERKEDVEAYVKGRFGQGTGIVGLDAVLASLEGPSGESGREGLVKFPDSLGPDFWDDSDFPTLER
jgi:hypothetical protein